MIKLSAISPKTIVSLGGEQGATTPEESQLKDLLSQMAYSMLQSKAPNLVPYITSFKPIELDMSENKAVGAFSIDLNGKKVMIPVIMSDGKVKSPEVFYSKDQDAFLPLNNQWMEEIQKDDSSSMGSSTEAPKALSSDVDIRALTLPPTTGRFVYASHGIDLSSIIDRCDNNTKVAFANVLKAKPSILRSVVKYNGSLAVELLKPKYTKVASSTNLDKGWYVLTSDSSKDSFSKAFGSNYKLAYQYACANGSAVRELRKYASVMVDREVPLDSTVMAQSGITQPNFPGVYNIVKISGESLKVIIIPRPFNAGTSIEGSDSILIDSTDVSGKIDRYGDREKGNRYLVVDSSKRVGVFDKIIALTTTETMRESRLVDEAFSFRKPKNGDKLFVSTKGSDITNAAYFPEGISNVTEVSSTETVANYLGHRVVFTSSKAVKTPRVTGEGSSKIFYVPYWYSPISTSGTLSEQDYIVDPDVLRNTAMQKVSSLSENTVRVKRSSDGSWAINGQYCSDKVDALRKLASSGINVEIASQSISSINRNSSRVYNLINPTRIHKLASIFGPEQPAASQGMPPQAGGMPPDMMGGMPPQAGGMPPDMMGGMPPQAGGMPPDMMGGMPPQAGGMPPDMMGGMPPQAGGMPPQTTQTMEAAANLNDQDLFNASAAASLLQYNPLNEAVAGEMPNIEKALDSAARILVSVQMREAELSQQIGPQAFNELESNLRKVLGGLGDIILSLHKQKNMSALPEGI